MSLKEQLCENDLNNTLSCNGIDINCCFKPCEVPKYLEFNIDNWYFDYDNLCCINLNELKCFEAIDYDPLGGTLLTLADCGLSSPGSILYNGNFCAYKAVIKAGNICNYHNAYLVFKKFKIVGYGQTSCDKDFNPSLLCSGHFFFEYVWNGTSWEQDPIEAADHPCCFPNICPVCPCVNEGNFQTCLTLEYCRQNQIDCSQTLPDIPVGTVLRVSTKTKLDSLPSYLSVVLYIPGIITLVDVLEIPPPIYTPPWDFCCDESFIVYDSTNCYNVRDSEGNIIDFFFEINGNFCYANFGDKKSIENFIKNCKVRNSLSGPDLFDNPLQTFSYHIKRLENCGCTNCPQACLKCCYTDNDPTTSIKFNVVQAQFNFNFDDVSENSPPTPLNKTRACLLSKQTVNLYPGSLHHCLFYNRIIMGECPQLDYTYDSAENTYISFATDYNDEFNIGILFSPKTNYFDGTLILSGIALKSNKYEFKPPPDFSWRCEDFLNDFVTFTHEKGHVIKVRFLYTEEFNPYIDCKEDIITGDGECRISICPFYTFSNYFIIPRECIRREVNEGPFYKGWNFEVISSHVYARAGRIEIPREIYLSLNTNNISISLIPPDVGVCSIEACLSLFAKGYTAWDLYIFNTYSQCRSKCENTINRIINFPFLKYSFQYSSNIVLKPARSHPFIYDPDFRPGKSYPDCLEDLYISEPILVLITYLDFFEYLVLGRWHLKLDGEISFLSFRLFRYDFEMYDCTCPPTLYVDCVEDPCVNLLVSDPISTFSLWSSLNVNLYSDLSLYDLHNNRVATLLPHPLDVYCHCHTFTFCTKPPFNDCDKIFCAPIEGYSCIDSCEDEYICRKRTLITCAPKYNSGNIFSSFPEVVAIANLTTREVPEC